MKARIAGALFLVFVAAAALQAHVIVTPRESAPGAEQTYSVSVPNEKTVSTTSLELDIPAGLHVMKVTAGEGFTFDTKKEGDRIVSITWKREIKPKERVVFTFTAHNPQSGALPWKAHQTFADGSMIHWVGERGSKEPASVTTIVAKGDATTKPAADPHQDHKP